MSCLLQIDNGSSKGGTKLYAGLAAGPANEGETLMDDAERCIRNKCVLVAGGGKKRALVNEQSPCRASEREDE